MKLKMGSTLNQSVFGITGPKQVYVYNGSFRADPKGDDNDFKILKQPNFIKDQDIISSLSLELTQVVIYFLIHIIRIIRENL